MGVELILPVGTNPLPGYVAATACLQAGADPPAKLHLVYSEDDPAINQAGTLHLAEALRDQLAVHAGCSLSRIELLPLKNVSSVAAIEADLARYFPADAAPPGGYHLNYTGGTKVMSAALHGYLTRTFPGRPPPSYLDARTCRLVYDDGTFTPPTGDLRAVVRVEITTLLALHGYQNPSFSKTVPADLRAPTRALANLVAAGGAADFLAWKNRSLRGIYYQGNNIILKASNFLANIKDPKVTPLVSDFARDLRADFKAILDTLNPTIIEPGGSLWIPDPAVTNRQFVGRVEKAVRFLDGRWLESFILDGLSAALPAGFDRGANLQAARPGSRTFELDLFVINGYQLTGIAATTDKTRHLCKSKGFEVLHRVRQAGGDEAKAVLVTAQEPGAAADLEEDVRAISGSSAGHFRVFGLADWPKIGCLVADFIRS